MSWSDAFCVLAGVAGYRAVTLAWGALLNSIQDAHQVILEAREEFGAR